MMFIVNEDAVIEALPIVVPPDGIAVPTGFTDPGITSKVALKATANNKGVSIDSFIGAWDITKLCPIRSASYTFVVGGVVVLASSIKLQADNFKVHLEQDFGRCIGQFTDPGSNPFPCSCTIQITNAGQSKVSGT